MTANSIRRPFTISQEMRKPSNPTAPHSTGSRMRLKVIYRPRPLTVSTKAWSRRTTVVRFMFSFPTWLSCSSAR